MGSYIMIIDDSPADVHLIQMAIRAQYPGVRFEVVRDGQKALEFFEEADKNELFTCPALIVLDINLPRRDGTTVLRRLRKTAKCEHTLVLVATSSTVDKDRTEMLEIGADGFFVKPSSYVEFMKLGLVVRSLLERRTKDESS